MCVLSMAWWPSSAVDALSENMLLFVLWQRPHCSLQLNSCALIRYFFIRGVFKSGGALFLSACGRHTEDWMPLWTCSLVFVVCVRVSVCRFKCLKSTHRSLDHWKLWGLKMLGGHFGVLIHLLMADRNSTHSDPGINVFVQICGWSSMWIWPEREGHPPLVQYVPLQEVWKMNPYLKPSAVRRNAEASGLSGLDRLDLLIPFY